MKLTFLAMALLLTPGLASYAATEEHLDKRFAVQPGGKLLVDVDFGSIELATNNASEVTVEVFRRVVRPTRDEEEAFLAERPVNFSPDGNTLTIYSRANRPKETSRGTQRTEGKYVITVPSQFSAQLKTDGGTIDVSDLNGEVQANSRGGDLKFARVQGRLEGVTAGGAVRVTGCDGAQHVKSSGGSIDVSGGAGSLKGSTSGGAVAVKNFRGPVEVKTAGGPINIENITGKVEGMTSGGSISAEFASPPSDDINLATSGGGVTLRVAENAAFDLDAATLAGQVSSDLPVQTAQKQSPNRLKGTINGGGKAVVLRTTAGGIQVRRL